MAPRKRKAVPELKEPVRVTRSSTRRGAESNSVGAAVADSPTKKKAKVKAEVKPKKGVPENGNGGSEIVDGELDKKRKSPRKADAKTKTTTIVIEHCKQCQRFRRRAEEAKTGLEAGVSGINVIINPEKPRRGCFEIRAEGGEKFVTLLELKRPFKPMMDLDIEKVVEDIVKKIK